MVEEFSLWLDKSKESLDLSRKKWPNWKAKEADEKTEVGVPNIHSSELIILIP